MVQVPLPIALTTPLESTVATVSSELLHLIPRLLSGSDWPDAEEWEYDTVSC